MEISLAGVSASSRSGLALVLAASGGLPNGDRRAIAFPSKDLHDDMTGIAEPRPVAILAHRGWWRDPSEKNAPISFDRALEAGYGIETDIRDRDGSLVISHDMAGADAQSLDDFLTSYVRYPARPTLALNIKADGLAELLAERLGAHGVDNIFVFDMSVPDTLGYLALYMPIFTRRSEYEGGSLLDRSAAGVWLDALVTPFVPPEDLVAALDEGLAVVLVSPELHRRPHEEAWHLWQDVLRGRGADAPACMICTDFPDEADRFFNGSAQ
jgi:hypothetical protein